MMVADFYVPWSYKKGDMLDVDSMYVLGGGRKGMVK